MALKGGGTWLVSSVRMGRGVGSHALVEQTSNHDILVKQQIQSLLKCLLAGKFTTSEARLAQLVRQKILQGASQPVFPEGHNPFHGRKYSLQLSVGTSCRRSQL